MAQRSPLKKQMDRAFRVWKLSETATQAAWRQYEHARMAFLAKRAPANPAKDAEKG